MKNYSTNRFFILLLATVCFAVNPAISQHEAHAAKASKSEHAEGIAPDKALSILMEGNSRFLHNKPKNKKNKETLALTSKGQKPYAVVFTCSDSRVAPEVTFDAGLGEIFTVRDAGNVADVNQIGSIEYAVEHLGSRLIMVLGHTSCGAVTAALDNHNEGNITELVHQIQPGLSAVMTENFPEKTAKVNAGVRANVLYQIEQLKSKSELLAEKIKKGEVKLLGAVYDLKTGKVEVLEAPKEKEKSHAAHAEGMDPNAAMLVLMDGHKRFLADKPKVRSNVEDIDRLSKGQEPMAVVFGCSDSRVSPELLFDAGLGEIFTVRVAGNITDVDGIASAEYAVNHLGSRLIIVMGHTACGAVKAALANVKEGHITDLVQDIKPALSEIEKTEYDSPIKKEMDAVRANILFQIQNMKDKSEIIREKSHSGEVKIIGMLYNIESGIITTEYSE